MRGVYTVTALVQFGGAFALAALVHPQIVRRLDLVRIPAEIAEGVAFARRQPTLLLVYGITVFTNFFAFAYSGLVAPLGIGTFPREPGAGRPAGRRRAPRRLHRRHADRGRPAAHGPPAGLRRRRGAVHGGPGGDGAVAVLLARLRPPGAGRPGDGRLLQHADDADADRGAARDALAPDGPGDGRHRHRAARRADGGRAGGRMGTTRAILAMAATGLACTAALAAWLRHRSS